MGRDFKGWKIKKAGENSKKIQGAEVRRQKDREGKMCGKEERQRQGWPGEIPVASVQQKSVNIAHNDFMCLLLDLLFRIRLNYWEFWCIIITYFVFNKHTVFTEMIRKYSLGIFCEHNIFQQILLIYLYSSHYGWGSKNNSLYIAFKPRAKCVRKSPVHHYNQGIAIINFILKQEFSHFQITSNAYWFLSNSDHCNSSSIA